MLITCWWRRIRCACCLFKPVEARQFIVPSCEASPNSRSRYFWYPDFDRFCGFYHWWIGELTIVTKHLLNGTIIQVYCMTTIIDCLLLPWYLFAIIQNEPLSNTYSPLSSNPIHCLDQLSSYLFLILSHMRWWLVPYGSSMTHVIWTSLLHLSAPLDAPRGLTNVPGLWFENAMASGTASSYLVDLHKPGLFFSAFGMFFWLTHIVGFKVKQWTNNYSKWCMFVRDEIALDRMPSPNMVLCLSWTW